MITMKIVPKSRSIQRGTKLILGNERDQHSKMLNVLLPHTILLSTAGVTKILDITAKR